MEHKIGIFYGSSTGTTQSLAEQIALKTGVSKADTHDVADAAPDTIDGYDCLLLGSSTWGDGDLQDDWYGFLDKIKTRDLSGKTVALFGCGDSESYPDTFCNALGTIYEELQPTGCRFVGAYEPQDYAVTDSGVCRDGKFVGLAVDELNEDDKTAADRPLDRSGEKGTVMSEQEYARFGDMKMFMHHIYEFKKGVRSLVLCTMCRTCASIVAERLRGQQIGYMIQEVSEKKVNLYFGKQECLDAVKTFIHKPLNRLSPEEDFMLGAMLGYDISMQCRRYCDRKSMRKATA